MNKVFVSLLVSFVSLFCGIIDLQAATVRLASYNVLNPIFEQRYTGHQTWSQRLPFIVENILTSDSDVICLQEVKKSAYFDIIQNSDINFRYMSFYISHAASQNGNIEGRDGYAFLYKADKVTLKRLVQSTDGARPTNRRDFYVDLQMNVQDESPVMFRIASTHLDSGKDLSIGNRQLSSLIEDVLDLGDESKLDFVVVCGDYNEGQDETSRPRFEIMQSSGFYTDGSEESTRPEALEVRHKGHVDWIYFKKISGLNFDLIPLSPIGDERGSDHKLIMTDVKIISL